MKRVITFLLVIFSLVSTSITCFATESKEVVECSVYAKYHPSNVELNTAIIENGKGTLTNRDGSSFIVELEEKYNGYMLVVHPITENDKDAFAWFRRCVPNNVVDFSPYEIYLLNSENQREELPNNTLIQISVSNRSDFILGLSYSSEIVVINTTYKDGKLIFNSSSRSNYYLICRKTVDTNVVVDSPQTGDTSNIHLWIVIFAISLIMLIITTRKYRVIRKQQ